MVAANKTRNGMEDLDGEVLQGSHIDCARQVREYSRLLGLIGESSLICSQVIWNDSRGVLYSPVRYFTFNRKRGMRSQPYVLGAF